MALGSTEWVPTTLALSDGRLALGDVIGESRFITSLLGMRGKARVRVAVDDPEGMARAVDIFFRTDEV